MTTLSPAKLRRVSWQCVHFELWPEQDDASAIAALRAAGLAVFELDGTLLTSQDRLFDALAATLAFPFFGRNWDALNDCLRDLSWVEAKGHVLVIRDARVLWRADLASAAGLVELWLFCAESWASHRVPFHLVFQIPVDEGAHR
jgi:hypothetical protein